jgi:membrane fusion protein (multidrug efflux system)
MMVRGILAAGISLLGAAAAWAQALPTAATIESVPLELTMPEHYHVTAVLEPIRRVAIVAPADGMIRGIEAPLGTTIRASQEIAQLDRAEATARLKVAQAEVREKQAVAKVAANSPNEPYYKAQLEAAEAKLELAQLALDRLTLRAPFSGRIMAQPVSSGQYVLKGTVIVELADVSSLKSLVPVDRRAVSEGSEAKVFVEEQEQKAKVQSILPLPESYASLRDLAAPFASAWVVVSNTKGDLAPGLRVRSATLPITPLAAVPQDSIKTTESAGAAPGTYAPAPGSFVQVLRNEYVTNIPVTVLGKVGAERIQITGALRSTDALIASSSVALLPGTLVRFSGSVASRVEGSTPNPTRQGAAAGIIPPSGVNGAVTPPGGPTAPRQNPPPAQGSAPF